MNLGIPYPVDMYLRVDLKVLVSAMQAMRELATFAKEDKQMQERKQRPEGHEEDMIKDATQCHATFKSPVKTTLLSFIFKVRPHT